MLTGGPLLYLEAQSVLGSAALVVVYALYIDCAKYWIAPAIAYESAALGNALVSPLCRVSDVCDRGATSLGGGDPSFAAAVLDIDALPGA